MSRTHHKHRNPYAIMRAQRKGEKAALRAQYNSSPKLQPVKRAALTRETRTVLDHLYTSEVV